MRQNNYNVEGVEFKFKDVYYYHKIGSLDNLYCVCLLFEPNYDTGKSEIISRGVSICSFLDIFNKKIARDIAFGRAFKAYISKKNVEKTAFRNLNINKKNIGFRDNEISRKIYIPDNSTQDDISLKLKFYENSLEECFLGYTFRKDKEKNYLVLILHRFTPIILASKLFTYKSEYKPAMTTREIDEFFS